MENLWKGIAITGIWLSCALVTWIIARAMVDAHAKGEVNLAALFILAFIATWLIVNAK